MQQIENFLDKVGFAELQKILLSPQFPWYLQHGVTYDDDEDIQFCHTVYKNDNFQSSFNLKGLQYFKEKLKITSLVRAKFNLQTRTETVVESKMHTDIYNPPEGLKTAILYINSNNGYTKFKDTKIQSVANKMVVFDAKQPHCGATNTCTEPYRVVFNLNYF